MLDGLLGRGFSSKCKSSIKLLRCRIEMIRRKRNSMTRFFKKDVAELIQSGLDVNAYGRAEGLIIELNLSSCYDLVEKFCGCILEQLPCMQKQRDFPEESREAVSSLMFAAARFADLPELRVLRSIFTKRYGNTLASSINQEFVEKLTSKPPSMDQKLQLMQEISQEFSINWDSKALIEKISNPSLHSWDQPKKHEPLGHGKDDTFNKMNKQDISSHSEEGLTPGTWFTTREEVNTEGKDIHPIATDNDHRLFEINISNYKDSSEFLKTHCNISRDKESSEHVKPHYSNNLIPPYVKPRGSKYGIDLEMPDADSIHKEPLDRLTTDTNHPARSIEYGNGNGYQDDSVSDSKPKPRSVRRRHLRPTINDKDATPVGDEYMSRSSNGRKIHGLVQSIPTKIVDHDDREKIIDSVLVNNRNKSSNHGTSEPTARSNTTTNHAADAGESLLNRKNDTACSNSESALPPTRAVSLPPEPMTTAELVKKPVRATTFQPDMINGGHMHSKLPDYDDLAARFTALKGGRKG